MATTTNSAAIGQFLSAWTAAGKPPVEKAVCPRHGNVRYTMIFAHREVELMATSGERFSDSNGVVELEWDFESRAFDLSGGSARLFFDRNNPVQCGR